jgi:hypothetical protein
MSEDWAYRVSKRWIDNMVMGMRKAGMTVGDPSEYMYELSAKMLREELAKVTVEPSETRVN